MESQALSLVLSAPPICWPSPSARSRFADAPHSRLDFARCAGAQALAGERTRARRDARCGAERIRRDRAGAPALRRRIGRHALRRQGHAADAGTPAERRARRRGRSRHRRRQRPARPARRGRRGPDRLHPDDRARLRAVRLQCVARTGQESVEPRSRDRRLVVRFGGGGRERRGCGRARIGHRRLAAHSGALLRHHRLEADLWPGLDARRDAACADARHHRTAGARRRRSAAGRADSRRPAGVEADPQDRGAARCRGALHAGHHAGQFRSGRCAAGLGIAIEHEGRPCRRSTPSTLTR